MPTFVDPSQIGGQHYDFVVIGTGFGSSFFVHRLLQERPYRILMLEWGKHKPHDQQIATMRNTDIHVNDTFRSDQDKVWNYTIGLGGGMNCWFAQTPRFHPTDFKLKSLYGRAQDWPIDYDDLERHYCDAEDIMSISGDPTMAAIMPRSRPFPQPPHRMNTPGEAMKKAMPGLHFAMPTARARIATEQRPNCCATFRCNLCPVDAKFSANNGMMTTYGAASVTMALECEVKTLEATNNVVKSVSFTHKGKDYRVSGDVVVLGANAVQSPAILHRSAMDGPKMGIGLHESYGTYGEALLDGMDGLDGSTITSGINYGIYDGAFRADYGAALVYFETRPTHGLRTEKGRWRQIQPFMVVTEDLPLDETKVTSDGDGMARIAFGGISDYARKGQDKAYEKLAKLFAPLPVEAINRLDERPTESHLQGTLRMGNDPATSVIDKDMVHHRYRNLVVVGSSSFATCSSANPSLTVAALSLRAAERFVGVSHAA